MMARPRKSDSQKLADRAKSLGIDLSDVNLPTTPVDTPDDVLLEAQAVLLYFDLNGKGFEHQICPQCGEPFAYKYSFKMSGMLCSMRCRQLGLEARGLRWTPKKPLEARWARGSHKGILPLIVPPEALSVLIAKKTNQDIEELRARIARLEYEKAQLFYGHYEQSVEGPNTSANGADRLREPM